MIEHGPLSGRPSPRGALPAPDDIRKTLGLGKRRGLRRLVTWTLILGVLGVAGWQIYAKVTRPAPPPKWITTAAERGDVVTLVSATGTVEPLRTVQIGAEISGRLSAVEVDLNSRVEPGQVLARFDTGPLEAKREQAEAQLDASKANVKQAWATYSEAKQAEARAKTLTREGVSAAQSLEAATAARARAYASHGYAKAQQRLAQAQLKAVLTDLDKAVIRAPVGGVVLTRTAEPGNTVAASFQAPVLFTLAEDLARMELRLAIDEADVGQVEVGMKATFTVDAYPDITFDAVVRLVTFAPTITQNVVTYEAVLTVDNARLLLRPGMTATASITSSAVRDVLRVPNTALRFKPPVDVMMALRGAGGGKGGGRGGVPGMPFGGRPGGGAGGAGAKAMGPMGPHVWVLRDGNPRPMKVETGASDGTHSEVRGGELKAGDELLVGIEQVTP
jgi:HlyD family secretion protein